MTDALDRIHIRDLSFRCIIGTGQRERREKQDVVVNITLHADLRRACGSDRIEDTIDYEMVRDQVIEMGQCSEFFLIERLAERVAGICLGHEGVGRVEVTVEKPNALRQTSGVAVQITRFWNQ